MWHFVKVGDHIFSLQHGWGTIIKKQILDTSRQKRLWINLESNSQTEIVEPCMVEIFWNYLLQELYRIREQLNRRHCF